MVVQWLNSKVYTTGLVCLEDPQFIYLFIFFMNILVHEHGPSYLFCQTQDVVYVFTTSIVRKKKKKKTITSNLIVYKHQFLIINVRVTEL